jgi:hypothetical protein
MKEREEGRGRGMMIGQTKQEILRTNYLLTFDMILFRPSGITGGHADSKVIS